MYRQFRNYAEEFAVIGDFRPTTPNQNRQKVDNHCGVAVLLLRIGLTPLAFVLVSRAQSRFGDWVGGRLMGLPLTTGPFLLAVCMTANRATAARAAAGVTGGQIAVVAFCCGYAHLARRMQPGRATVTALGIALAAELAVHSISGIWATAVAVWLVIALSLLLWPWPSNGARPAADSGTNRLLPRAATSTAIVATSSTLVPLLGARVAGAIASAPVLLSMMLPGAHRSGGPEAATDMARGTIVSMIGTIGFSTVLATCLGHHAVLPSLLLATAVLIVLSVAAPRLGQLLERASESVRRRTEAVLERTLDARV
jgi:hypothetical protein